MFLNVSNHPSDKWSDKQREAALAISKQIVETCGEGTIGIKDIPFPNIPPAASAEDIYTMADHFIENIAEEYEAENTAIHIMGELTFTYNFVNASNIHDFTCYAATSERNSIDNADGTKTIQFDFVQFRRY
jgi:hypothetical protein